MDDNDGNLFSLQEIKGKHRFVLKIVYVYESGKVWVAVGPDTIVSLDIGSRKVAVIGRS